MNHSEVEFDDFCNFVNGMVEKKKSEKEKEKDHGVEID